MGPARPTPRLAARARAAVVAAVVALGVAGVAPAAGVAFAGTGAAAGPPASEPAPAGAPAVSANPFVPDEANISECISSLPGPDCGSAARGGWRQTALFAVVVVALVAIGARIFVAVRREEQARARTVDAPAAGPANPPAARPPVDER